MSKFISFIKDNLYVKLIIGIATLSVAVLVIILLTNGNNEQSLAELEQDGKVEVIVESIPTSGSEDALAEYATENNSDVESSNDALSLQDNKDMNTANVGDTNTNTNTNTTNSSTANSSKVNITSMKNDAASKKTSTGTDAGNQTSVDEKLITGDSETKIIREDSNLDKNVTNNTNTNIEAPKPEGSVTENADSNKTNSANNVNTNSNSTNTNTNTNNSQTSSDKIPSYGDEKGNNERTKTVIELPFVPIED